MVPVQVISEYFDKIVKWNEAWRDVVIKNKDTGKVGLEISIHYLEIRVNKVEERSLDM